MRRLSLFAALAVVIATLTNGCSRGNAKPNPSDAKAAAKPKPTTNRLFATAFQTETEYVVSAIASDIYEQLAFAALKTVPHPTEWPIVASTVVATNRDCPTLELVGLIGKGSTRFSSQVTVNGPIWSPKVYADLAKQMAEMLGLKPSANVRTATAPNVPAELLDTTALTVERKNQETSEALQKDFTNAALHEQAALVLGVFCLRDHSGRFFDLRSPLSRLTSHLVIGWSPL